MSQQGFEQLNKTGPEFLNWDSAYCGNTRYFVPEGSGRPSKGEIDQYIAVLEAAQGSISNPYQSGFSSQAAAALSNGEIVIGANQEDSLNHAYSHGETAVVSAARSRYGQEVDVESLGFFQTGLNVSDLNPSPCGACRDVLMTEVDPETAIIAGSPGVMAVTKFSDYLFSDFDKIDHSIIGRGGIDEAAFAIEAATGDYLPEEMRDDVYGVSIVAKNGLALPGSFYTNAGYDAITPGLSAVIAWKSEQIKQLGNQQFEPAKIVIAAFGQQPDVLYRDRQALLEFDEVYAEHSGSPHALSVDLVELDSDTKGVVSASRTNTLEWLPRPFSPASFGMNRVISSQAAKIGDFMNRYGSAIVVPV